MAESLIEMDNTDEFSSATTVDHKIRCIDGKAQYDMVCYDRSLESGSGGSKTVYDLYDIHTWQPMRQYLADPGVNYKNVPRPVNLEKMIEIAEKIAQADLCLGGHFNDSIMKAKRTIAGKTYIYRAMKKPMILGENAANHELFSSGDKDVYFVKMGDSAALAELILKIRDSKK